VASYGSLWGAQTGAAEFDDRSSAPGEQFTETDFYSTYTGDSTITNILQYGLSVSQGTVSGVEASSAGYLPYGCNLNSARNGIASNGSTSSRVLGTYQLTNYDVNDLNRIRVSFDILHGTTTSFGPAFVGTVGFNEPPPCVMSCLQYYENPVSAWHTGSSCVRLTFYTTDGKELDSGLVSVQWKTVGTFQWGRSTPSNLPTSESVEIKYHNDFSNVATMDEASLSEIPESSLNLNGDQYWNQSVNSLCSDPSRGCHGGSGMSSIPRAWAAEYTDEIPFSTDPGNTADRPLNRDRSRINFVSIDLRKMTEARRIKLPRKFIVQVKVVQQTVPWFAGGGWFPDMTSPHFRGSAASMASELGGQCTSAFYLGGYRSDNPNNPNPNTFDPRLPCNADIAGPGQSRVPDGEITPDDIIVFINMFFAGDFRADISGPGQSRIPDGKFTADDIIVYFNCFFAASPPYQGDDE
jgi:hypothetical protein